MIVRIGEENFRQQVADFIADETVSNYLLIEGDAGKVLKAFPSESIHTCITSPPYWGQRKYNGASALGTEVSFEEYVNKLTAIFSQLKRVLTDDGSFWLNIGDTYRNKSLCGIPWRVALTLQQDGWLIRNAVIWDKVKGNPCNARDKLRNMYEYVFHFVKSRRCYYNVDAVRTPPKRAYYRNRRIVTPTGVSGRKYEQQILTSPDLTDEEKQNALAALYKTLAKVESGELIDFRMIIRGRQRITHSDSKEVSGRAQEVEKKGFCILPYHRKGSKPGDIWRIIPEDRWRKDSHCAVFPKELCVIPIKATCPPGGIVLDPFVGTGTALVGAIELGRRAIGIDTSIEYLNAAQNRIAAVQLRLSEV